VFGYEETEDGDLVMQTNPEKIYKGTREDMVGPGNYEVAKLPPRAGTNWKIPMSKRRDSLNHSDSGVGPGSYNIENKELLSIYKYKPSSNFVSKVNRGLLPKARSH
jgi:hypothetical protein